MSPRRRRTDPPHRPSPLPDEPNLGNGAERFDNDGYGLGVDEGPESQGRLAGEAYGQGAQGEYGDEDYDASDFRDVEAPEGIEDELTVLDDPAQSVTIEHVGPGRGSGGGSEVVEPVPDAGRGDDGLARPDASVGEAIAEALAEVEITDPIELAIEVRQGMVTVDGVVDDVGARDAVESCIAAIAGVRGIDNRLRLRTDVGS